MGFLVAVLVLVPAVSAFLTAVLVFAARGPGRGAQGRKGPRAQEGVSADTSDLTPQISHLRPHTSHFTPHNLHISVLTPQSSPLTPNALHLTPHSHTPHLSIPVTLSVILLPSPVLLLAPSLLTPHYSSHLTM